MQRRRDQRGDDHHRQHQQRQAPIADEHAPQLLGDVLQHAHQTASANAGRTSEASTTPASKKTPARTNSAQSPPGNGAPSPSAVQNTPNDDSITPTPNFSVFSGTFESGLWIRRPVSSTARQAPNAPSAAQATRP